MRELLAPLVPTLHAAANLKQSIPHFSRRATWPEHCLLDGVPVCLLSSYLTVAMERGGGYPVRPPVTCIDISHVAEKILNFQVR